MRKKKKPSIDAFSQGVRDFYKVSTLAGGHKVCKENPFEDFAQLREWERGFNHAYYSNLSKRDNDKKD